MQPNSKVEMDEKSFHLLKRTIRNIAVPNRERMRNPVYKTPLPESVGIKLTNRCNLRCVHCFQWNEDGYHQNMDKAEQNLDLDIGIIQKVLDETREVQSRLYIWGGEPLFHKQFSEIAAMLAKDLREMTICTNGLLLDRFEQEIISISDHLELLIAIEGFEEEHDLIRGKGTFKKTMAQLDRLIALRDQGIYKGRIAIHSVINDSMIGKMYEFLEYFEDKGVDLVILCFPWYISRETSYQMDTYFKERFSWLSELQENHISSWHAFKYRLGEQSMTPLMEELRRINERVWNIRVRYQPGLEYDEIETFARGEAMTSRCATKCLVLSTRMDITPDGSVQACKFFSEFTVGNLKEHSVAEVWESASYDRIRDIINNEGLTPACSKCSVLYLHSI